MLEKTKPMTHVAWAQHYEGGRFREWVEIGRGRIDVDDSGTAIAHVYENRIPRGGGGYTCLMPIGVRPPDPQPQAKRPAQPSDMSDGEEGS
jgi:hypothetical protein